MTTEYNIRKATKDDLPFIYSTWLNSLKHSSDIGKSCRSGLFFEQYREIIDYLLFESEIKIACHRDHPEVIFGYAVLDQISVHYIFVKEAFRKMGIASNLVPEINNPILPVKFHTHETFMLDKMNVKTTYNPFLLYKKQSPTGEQNGQTKED